MAEDKVASAGRATIMDVSIEPHNLRLKRLAANRYQPLRHKATGSHSASFIVSL